MYRILPKSMLSLFVLVLPLISFANSPLDIKKSAPQSYIVVKGDTLWDISAMYLASPWLWPRLWQVNEYIENPHLIYPGDKLNLVWRDGQPILTLKPMVKLSPKVRVLDKQAVPVVRDSLLLPYLEFDRLMTRTQLDQEARVLGSSHGKHFFASDELLYITGEQHQSKWGIFHPTETYTRGEHQVVLLKQVAWATLHSSDQQISGLQVTKQVQEILRDDIALPIIDPASSPLNSRFYPQPSPPEMTAQILGAVDGGQYLAKDQVVVIDQGTDDALVQGSTFELYQQASPITAFEGDSQLIQQAKENNLQLPNFRIGSLMVIRPYQYFSLALITESQQPVGLDAIVQAPVSP
ncbi:LysM peptidoglycan-binding domain-containing protein [Vibrio sp. 404]|uniref:LysM peptidoglycan-binding domain-containing protein n=1 Tax=Vibrio marinisediminis TaxID=2758441 RepID=A0A7W2FTU0_9VIBR|nr:LysM peptidoglycan-binding domain-containing protein [Vibrio marinisediminis]MBA5764127.1 LysM peptidoglycan-binding domain-containing protein [Vibrio marinisediminis]